MRRTSRCLPLLLAAILANAAGCFPLPLPTKIEKGPTFKGFTDPRDLPDYIKVDRTTRAEVIALLGKPLAAYPPDQLIYSWDVFTGYYVYTFLFRAEPDQHTIRARLEFDSQQVLRGYDLREQYYGSLLFSGQRHSDIYAREGDLSPEPTLQLPIEGRTAANPLPTPGQVERATSRPGTR